MDFPPSDPANTVEFLVQRMDNLRDNITQLQELLDERRAVDDAAGVNGLDRFGDFARVFTSCNILADAVADLQYSQRRPVIVQSNHPNGHRTLPRIRQSRGGSGGRLMLKTYVGACIGFLTFLQILAFIFCFLGVVTTTTAFFWNDDIIETRLNECIGGTFLEVPVTKYLHNVLYPIQNQMMSISASVPIYKMPLWEKIYLHYFRRSQKDCEAMKSIFYPVKIVYGFIRNCLNSN